MALYTIRKIESARITGQTELKCQRTQSLRAKPLTLLGSSIAVILLVSTYCFAGPFHFQTKPIFGGEIDGGTVALLFPAHSAVLAAAFGFQAAGSSTITVRTYDAPTGAILSEDSFDVSVKEGSTESNANKGRIFAGGIGMDSEGKSRFMLRVYDAETGRFLWEGQLNLRKVGEGGMTNTSIALVPNNPSMVQTSFVGPVRLQTLFSLRAVNPATGRLVWQDQFIPGSQKEVKGDGVLFDVPAARAVHKPIEHRFDLIVQTFDRSSGRLLWEDSFEQLNRIEAPELDPSSNAYPQAIPSWSPPATGSCGSHRTGLR